MATSFRKNLKVQDHLIFFLKEKRWYGAFKIEEGPSITNIISEISQFTKNEKKYKTQRQRKWRVGSIK